MKILNVSIVELSKKLEDCKDDSAVLCALVINYSKDCVEPAKGRKTVHRCHMCGLINAH